MMAPTPREYEAQIAALNAQKAALYEALYRLMGALPTDVRHDEDMQPHLARARAALAATEPKEAK